MPADDPTLGQEIIRWIESTCRVPEGALVGQPLQLMEWQRDAIRKTYDNPHGTRRCIISVGRKSSKSSLCSCLFLVHLVGLQQSPTANSTALHNRATKLRSCTRWRPRSSECRQP
jgi:phage terminase large subunit-like protein